MARHRDVKERMLPFHLRAIERGGGAAVSAADFYTFQQRQGRGAATPRDRVSGRRPRAGTA